MMSSGSVDVVTNFSIEAAGNCVLSMDSRYLTNGPRLIPLKEHIIRGLLNL